MNAPHPFLTLRDQSAPWHQRRHKRVIVRLLVGDTSDDDLAWAEPYLDQARDSIAHGNAISVEEFLKRLDAKLHLPQSPKEP